MSYMDHSQISGEGPVYRTKLHWIVFSAPVVYVLFGSLTLANHAPSLGWIFVLLGLFGLLLACANYSTSEFSLTTKRVLIKTGLMRMRSLDLARAEGISVIQGIWARMLGYGTIVIGRTGGTKEKFYNIKAPVEFGKRVQEQIAATQGGLRH